MEYHIKQVIQLKNIQFRYDKEREWLLNNINLTINQGDRIGIIGGNGCGKSTIAKLLLGIYQPQNGIVNIFDKPVRWHNHYPSLGYIGDPGYNAEELGLPDNLTIAQIIELMSSFYQQKERKEQLRKMVNVLGLKAIDYKNIRTLSTGERKRLMACLSLSKSPEILILDEPTDGLDQNIKEIIEALLKEFINQQRTIIYIAHNRVEIDSYTNKVYRLHRGKLSPERQYSYQVILQEGAVKNTVLEKAGEVQGRMVKMMDNNIGNNEFSIHVKPIKYD